MIKKNKHYHKRNEMKKKMQAQQHKKCQSKKKRKTTEQRPSDQKYLTCHAKHCWGIKLIFFCVA